MVKGQIQAVHDKDLEEFLESIGELKKVQKGKVRCCFCRKRISFENIQSIFPLGGEIKYCCKKYECYNMLLERSKIK